MGLRRSSRVLAATAAVVISAFGHVACGSPDAGTSVIERVEPAAPETPPPAPAPAPLASRRPVLPPLVIDLGEVDPFEDVLVEIPEGTLGFNVVVQSELEGARVGILRIRSPTGECVHDRYIPKGGSHETSLSPFTAIAAAAVPQGQGLSTWPVAPGVWRLVFGDGRWFGPDGKAPPPPVAQVVPPMRARIVIQRGATPDGAFVGARLDVVVHVPEGLRLGARALAAADAERDASIAKRLDVFFEGLKSLFDVDRGDVRFEAAPAELAALTERTLFDAFAVTRGTSDEQALHVVLTNDVMVGIGANAWGVAPGVPGAAVLNGTPMSGVVLAIGDTDPALDGLVLLHETGHFLGLSHTSELDGEHADPIADTERCTAFSPDDPASLERCPDRANLMFPTYSSGWSASLEVSAAQRAVVHGSPVLRVYADGPALPRAPFRAFQIAATHPEASAPPASRQVCAHIGMVHRPR